MNKDIYQQITDRIIAALETGTAPWVKPWASHGAPRNAITGRAYTGINTVLLAMSPHANPLFMTFNQAKDAGGTVRKGEHGTQVVFFKPLKVEDKSGTESKDKVIPLLRSFVVFNVQQIDGLPEKYAQAQQPQIDSFTTNDKAEALLAQAVIEHGKSNACFIPSRDVIHMPNKSDFRSIPDYYATGLHELTHWSGHKSRLARDFSGRFGDSAYGFEELIAELGAAFLCAHCSIDGQLQHDSYIASWLQVLHSDKRAIFTAGARKASEFLVGVEAEEEDQASTPAPTGRDFEAELRKIWTDQGVPEEKQNALIEGIAAKARPGAQVGPFTVLHNQPARLAHPGWLIKQRANFSTL